MELCRVYGEFEAEELAELAAGRIRRKIRGIHRMTVCQLTHSMQPVGGRVRFTMLPANLRMMNYVTDVMYAEIYDRAIPEPYFRRNVELMIVCEDHVQSQVESMLHAAGAMRVRRES